MTQNIVKIADLANFSPSELDNVTIKASVSTKSIRHGNNRHAYFYMDLRDDSGEISAVAYSNNEPCDNQLHVIEQDKTYLITNVTLEQANKRYTSLPNEKEIVLNNNSIVKLCGNAPKFEWPLTPLNEVYNQDEEFFNVVGLCTSVTERDIVLGELSRQVTLVDETRTEVILDVWNQETSLFDELDLNLHPVLFVKDARLYKYQGCTSLTTSRYLKLLDPDDPRAAKIRKAIPQTTPSTNHDSNTSRALARIGADRGTSTNARTWRHVKIADLSDDSVSRLDIIAVVATVTMKSISYYGNKTDVHFFMELRDDSGNMAAIVQGDACVKFQHIIAKNITYTITGFSLDNSNNYYTSVSHRKILLLDHESDVKLCGYAPRLEWPLSPLIIAHGLDKMEYYHAFGLCTNVTETDSVQSLYKSKQVTLVDQLGRELFLEVEDEEAAIFDALDLNTHPVFFVKDARQSDKKLEGKQVLMTGMYLELLDPDDPRARRVTNALCSAEPITTDTVNK